MSAVLEAQEPSARYVEVVHPALVRQFELLATARGGVARLRQLILALAVRGKLARQNPDDEPADALMQRVHRARQSGDSPLRGKRGNRSSYQATGEEPFASPAGWMWSTLPELCAIAGGSTPSKAVADNWIGDIPWVSPKDMKVRVIEDAEDHIASAALTGSLSLIPSGSLLMVVRGMILAHSFPVAVTRVAVSINQDMKALTPFEPSLLPFLILLCEGMKTEILALVDRSTHGTCKLESRKLFGLQVPLPPLAEQARIVARVDELMRLCDALEAKGRLEAEQHFRLLGTLLGTLTDSSTPEGLAANWQRVADHFDLLLDRPEAVDALEQTILQLAVRGLLVPQDPGDEPASLLLQEVLADRRRPLSDIAKADKGRSPIDEAEVRFALPAGWSWARLSEISNVIVDCPHSTAKFVNTGLLCLDTNSFKDGKLLPHKLRFVSQQTFEERIARLQPEPGDLVFAREGSVGESIIIPPGTMCCLGQRVMLFRLSGRVSNEFVRLAITTKDFLDALLSLHKGIGAKHVNVGDMRNAVVPVPPFREQQRILARVTELRRLCADLRQRLDRSSATRAGLAEALIDQTLAA